MTIGQLLFSIIKYLPLVECQHVVVDRPIRIGRYRLSTSNHRVELVITYYSIGEEYICNIQNYTIIFDGCTSLRSLTGQTAS